MPTEVDQKQHLKNEDFSPQQSRVDNCNITITKSKDYRLSKNGNLEPFFSMCLKKQKFFQELSTPT